MWLEECFVVLKAQKLKISQQLKTFSCLFFLFFNTTQPHSHLNFRVIRQKQKHCGKQLTVTGGKQNWLQLVNWFWLALAPLPLCATGKWKAAIWRSEAPLTGSCSDTGGSVMDFWLELWKASRTLDIIFAATQKDEQLGRPKYEWLFVCMQELQSEWKCWTLGCHLLLCEHDNIIIIYSRMAELWIQAVLVSFCLQSTKLFAYLFVCHKLWKIQVRIKKSRNTQKKVCSLRLSPFLPGIMYEREAEKEINQMYLPLYVWVFGQKGPLWWLTSLERWIIRSCSAAVPTIITPIIPLIRLEGVRTCKRARRKTLFTTPAV